jgi:hypothetical protein
MGRQRPASVTNAIRVQGLLVLVGALTTVLTAVREDDLIASWAAKQPPGAQPPAIVPVVVVLFVTFALLIGVLLVFFHEGHPSARLSLTGIALFFLFAAFVIYRLDPPTLFVLLSVVSALLDLVLLWFLWHPDTNAYVRGAELAAERDG